MERPSPEFSSFERVLNGKEIDELPCTVVVRVGASKYDGIILESEFVTQDERFGYVYRYDIANYIVDDGNFHPEMGTKGIVSKIISKLVIYSSDCIDFTFEVGIESVDGRKV
ncbi:hypothetical protein [Methylovulum psychrotolerans]|nr:hypothetical protein [Methylovulum psychrotolerans]